MFVLEAEPKELTIVLILGPINVEDLSKLKGLSGLDSLGDVQKDIKSKKGGGDETLCFCAGVFCGDDCPVAVLASGGEGGFNGVCHTGDQIPRACHRIPFLGLVSFVMGKNAEYGVSNVHVAEFEDFREAMDGEELNRMSKTSWAPNGNA